MAEGCILLAGQRRSPTALSLLWRLQHPAAGMPRIKAVFCVREWSWSRFMQLRRRFGPEVARKIRGTLGFTTTGMHDDERATYAGHLAGIGVPYRSLGPLCRSLGVPFHVIPGFSAPATARLLAQYAPERALFTGGGRVPADFLARIPGGVINIHSAWLPLIRGMSAAEWSLYFGLNPAATLHYMDTDLDTGPILARRIVAVERGERLGRIRARVVLAGLDLLLETLPQITAGTCTATENPKKGGRRYFVMAPAFRAVVQSWIDAGLTPAAAPDQAQPGDLRPAPQRR